MPDVGTRKKGMRNFMAKHYLPYGMAKKQYLQTKSQSVAQVTASESKEVGTLKEGNKNLLAKVDSMSKEMPLVIEELEALKESLNKPCVKGTATSSQAESTALEIVEVPLTTSHIEKNSTVSQPNFVQIPSLNTGDTYANSHEDIPNRTQDTPMGCPKPSKKKRTATPNQQGSKRTK